MVRRLRNNSRADYLFWRWRGHRQAAAGPDNEHMVSAEPSGSPRRSASEQWTARSRPPLQSVLRSGISVGTVGGPTGAGHSGGRDGTVRIWDPATGEQLATLVASIG